MNIFEDFNHLHHFSSIFLWYVITKNTELFLHVIKHFKVFCIFSLLKIIILNKMMMYIFFLNECTNGNTYAHHWPKLDEHFHYKKVRLHGEQGKFIHSWMSCFFRKYNISRPYPSKNHFHNFICLLVQKWFSFKNKTFNIMKKCMNYQIFKKYAGRIYTIWYSLR